MNAHDKANDVHEPYYLWLHQNWLRHDTWTEVEGILLLGGIDPKYTVCLDSTFDGWPRGFQSVFLLEGRQIAQPAESSESTWTAQEVATDDDLLGIRSHYETLRELWQSGSHPGRAEPEYFVSWALSKGIHIDWLADARSNGRFVEDPGRATAEAAAKAPSSVKDVEPSDRQTLLRIVAGLLEIMLEQNALGRPRAGFENQKAIAEGLLARTEGIRGLGPTTLDQRFAEANKSLTEARRAARGGK